MQHDQREAGMEHRYLSHSIELGGYGHQWGTATKETVTVRLPTQWRGRPVVVTLEASRYVHSEGWSDWRIWAPDAREDTNGEGLGSNLTDLARTRLSDQLKPIVSEWLKSDAYPTSEAQAYVHAVQNKGRDLRPYGDPPSRDLRRVIEVNADKLPTADAARLLKAADAYDTFAKFLEG